MTRAERELLRGAGPVAVLRLLSTREMYGYELAAAIDRQSEGVLAMGQSTLYPLLYNLESKGLVRSRREERDGARPRRYYAITAAGRRWLEGRSREWRALGRAMRLLGILTPSKGSV